MIRYILFDIPDKHRNKFRKVIRYLLYDQSYKLLLNYRIGKKFVKSKNPFLRLLGYHMKNRQMYKWGCDISYDANIGKRVVFTHPTNVVIGYKVNIGDDVKIWHSVTLGEGGTDATRKSYPVIKNGARIYPGAVVIGAVTVGKNAVIGANSVVKIDVPDQAVAVGAPAKIIRKGNF